MKNGHFFNRYKFEDILCVALMPTIMEVPVSAPLKVWPWLERSSIGPVLSEERQDPEALRQQPVREYYHR